VLLSPGTGVTPAEEFSWSYERRFDEQHRPWCAVTMPDRTQGDIQVAGEYLVHAIRAMYLRSHRRIGIVGHSQGGMSMRWALRFWPDTRRMVADVIGLAGDNAGTTTFTSCHVGHPTCTPAIWQQVAGSRFLTALNSGAETFAGIAYTEVFTRDDEVVKPSTPDSQASSALHTGSGQIANVAIQSICPRDRSEHLEIGTTDPVAAALVDDALDHPGPAVPARLSRVVCFEAVAPGISPRVAGRRLPALARGPAIPGTTGVRREPPLACYVYASGCPG
jgi:pimeloyl-ACP methyl ester carboxylesterase